MSSTWQWFFMGYAASSVADVILWRIRTRQMRVTRTFSFEIVHPNGSRIKSNQPIPMKDIEAWQRFIERMGDGRSSGKPGVGGETSDRHLD